MIAKETAHLGCTPMILDHHWTLTVVLPPLHQKQPMVNSHYKTKESKCDGLCQHVTNSPPTLSKDPKSLHDDNWVLRLCDISMSA